MVDYVIELSDEFVPPPESGGVGLSDEYIAARVASINDKFATTDATGSFLAARGIIEADAVQTVDLAVVAAPSHPDEPPTVTDPPPTKAPAMTRRASPDSVGELSAEDSPPLAGGVVAIIVIGAILLVVLVLGTIAYAAKTKGLHSNPKIPWGYRPSTPPAGARRGYRPQAQERRRGERPGDDHPSRVELSRPRRAHQRGGHSPRQG